MNEFTNWIKQRRNQLFILTAALLSVGLFTLYRSASREILVVEDGRSFHVRTIGGNVSAVIRAADLALNPADSIFPALDEPLSEDTIIVIERARPVTIIHLSDEKIIRTPETKTGNILALEGVKLFPDDRVWIDGIPHTGSEAGELEVVSRIEIQPALPASLILDESELEIWLGGHSLAEGLWLAGYEIMQADQVSGDLSAPLTESPEVEMRRSFPVSFSINGEVSETRVLASTVGEAVESAGAVLIGMDQTFQSETEPVSPGSVITLSRVVEEVVLNQEPLPFDVAYQADPEALIDTQTLLETGEYGVRAERIRIRYEDGEEIDRLVEGSWVVREPSPRVVGYGTRIEINTVDTPEGPLEYWRALEMRATSYSPSRAGVPDDYPYFGITACGIKAEKGVVAVDRRYIPFYTPLYIPGYGTAIACDTGSAIVGRKIDLGYDDDNWESWHWNVTVYFLTPVPDPANIAWIIP